MCPSEKPATSREAALVGRRNGWTVKETAFHTGYTTKSLQNIAQRMKISFPYGGIGPKPKFPVHD